MPGLRENANRGQSIIEVALLVPLLILLIVGAYDVSAFASNKVEVVSAARHGVRIASVLGGIPANPSPPATHTCDGTLVNTTTVQVIDSQVVQAVVAATSQTSYTTINEIDVYRPSSATGVYASGDHINRYRPNGTPIGSAGFPLTERCQGPLGANPTDVSIGVQIDWTFVAPNGLGFGRGPVTFAHVIDYSVEKMQQCTDNCL